MRTFDGKVSNVFKGEVRVTIRIQIGRGMLKDAGSGNVNNKKDNECDKGKPDAKDDNSGKQADSLENDDL